MQRWIAVAVVVLGALGGAASASAATMCVHQPADPCAAGTIDEGASLTTAFGDATTEPGDIITIGPGSFVSPDDLQPLDAQIAAPGRG